MKHVERHVERQNMQTPPFACEHRRDLGGAANAGLCVEQPGKQKVAKFLPPAEQTGHQALNEITALKEITKKCAQGKFFHRPPTGCRSVVTMLHPFTDNRSWVVLPYLTVGGTPVNLSQVITQGGILVSQGGTVRNLANDKAFRDAIVRGMWDGVRMLHTLNFVHNDINPGNIFLTDQRDGSISAVVGDYGGVTKEGKRRYAGSPAYVHGGQVGLPFSKKTDDIFACVLVVHEVACNQHMPWYTQGNDVHTTASWDAHMQETRGQTLQDIKQAINCETKLQNVYRFTEGQDNRVGLSFDEFMQRRDQHWHQSHHPNPKRSAPTWWHKLRGKLPRMR